MSPLQLSTTTPFSLLKSNPPKQPPLLLRQNYPFSLLRFPNLRRRPLELAAAATSDKVAATAEEMPEGLQRELMPRHVAVIMDGNVRWAHQRGLPGSMGHEAGVQSLRKLVGLCGKWGVKVLSVFAFSYDNWVRPKVEVEFLMKLFERGIKSELDKFVRKTISARCSLVLPGENNDIRFGG